MLQSILKSGAWVLLSFSMTQESVLVQDRKDMRAATAPACRCMYALTPNPPGATSSPVSLCLSIPYTSPYYEMET